MFERNDCQRYFEILRLIDVGCEIFCISKVSKYESYVTLTS